MRKVMRLGELLKTEDASKLDIVLMVLRMSIPAILSQITFIAMMYIDATMVGSLGASASASVGLVSSATWLLFGITMATTTGFAIIASQKLGAEKYYASGHYAQLLCRLAGNGHRSIYKRQSSVMDARKL